MNWDSLRPLSGRRVSVDGQSTTTDANGQFTLLGVSTPYDAVVMDPDGASVSVYKGLSRRDPLLPHDGALPLSRAALVSGDVSGAGNYPLGSSDVVVVRFFSPLADQFWPLGGGLSALEGGPAYGPIPLRWDGSASISGELTALGRFQAEDGGSSLWFVHQPLTLSDGQRASVNLALTPVTQVGHISGSIRIPPNSHVVEKELFYRLPIVHARIPVDAAPSGAFDDDVPDLGDLGAELCAGAAATPGSFFTERCGIALREGDATLTLQGPPSFSSPADGATVAKGTQFSWTNYDNGVYMVRFEAASPSASTPLIHLFTSDTNAVWPDLAGLGVGFPVGTSYHCSVGGLGPYASMDDALGPDGAGAPFPTELRRSFSSTLNMTTAP